MIEIENKVTFRREELEELSTSELDSILRTELDRDTPNRETVLLVLSILEYRDPTNLDNRLDGAKEAWEDAFCKPKYPESLADKANRKSRKWFGVIAAAAAVALVLLITVPQTVGADNIFEIIGRWTRELFNFSNGTNDEPQEEYVFQTDHNGLQQIYDAVVEQGVTEPVVPMWIPDGYSLEEFKLFSHAATPKLYARFARDNKYIQLMIEIHKTGASNEYPKDDVNVEIYEHKGTCYYVLPNEDTIKAIWNSGNVECSLVTNDTEEVLYQILNSLQRRFEK